MSSTAYDYFGAMVEEYDSLIYRAVPVYDELLGALDAYLPRRAAKVLELGCGTGNYTEVLAKRYPDAELTLVDGAEEMLQATRFRLGSAERLRGVEARFEDLDFEPESFDLVSSCIALHHVAEKEPLFARLRAVLKPGGMLVFGDQMGGANQRNGAINWNRMVDFWRLPGHCTPEEQASLTQHARDHDHYESIGAHLRKLEAVGFRDVDCVWRKWMWGVVTAWA